MQVWAASFNVSTVGELDEIYRQGLDVIDAESRRRLERFYKREDAFRGLVGCLLVRKLLKERGVPTSGMTFGATKEGKPYIACPGLNPPIGYNITHDSGVIAMAFASGDDLYPDPPAYRIGIDVMRLQLPKRHTLSEWVNIFAEQLTPLELEILLPSPPLPEQEALRRFYLIWTLKEAYTKALGLGLGFDFSRIEYDVPRDVVRIDKTVPIGWEFVRFVINRDEEEYVGVAARYTGEEPAKGDECVVTSDPPGEWLRLFDAAEFVRRATEELR